MQTFSANSNVRLSVSTAPRHSQVVAHAAVAAPAPPTAVKAKQTSTTGTVSYVQPVHDTEGLYTYVYEVPEGKEASNLVREEKQVTVTDLKSVPNDFSLEENGFELHKLSVPSDINWDNEEDVQSRYYPLVQKKLLEVTGATRVHIFDHTLRKGHVKSEEEKKFAVEGQGQPVGMVHVDYTTLSGVQRLDKLLPDEADQLRKTPFAVIQVWRPLSRVQASPLGMIDASTVGKEDLMPYAIHFPGRTGWNYGVQYNPEHKWYYAKQIEADEAYVFVCYDSRAGRARFTPHTGFRDHSASPDAPPRESVELRSYCFFENEPVQEYAKEL